MKQNLKTCRGFTLIEVMVALAIIAIALASLIKASGSHTHSASYLKNKTLAHYVALNEITQLHIEKAWPSLGTEHKSSEMAGVEWYWTRKVSKTADPKDNIRTVEFTVYLDADRNNNITRLQGHILNPKAPY